MKLFFVVNHRKAAYLHLMQHFYSIVEAAGGQNMNYLLAHDVPYGQPKTCILRGNVKQVGAKYLVAVVANTRLA